MSSSPDVFEGLRERFGDDVLETSTGADGVLRATVQQARPVEILEYLRNEAGFDRFVDLTAIDRSGLRPGEAPDDADAPSAPESGGTGTDEKKDDGAGTGGEGKGEGDADKKKAKTPPDPLGDFQVLVTLRASAKAQTLLLHVAILGRKTPKTPSITPVYPAAEWAEREVAEMFGIAFKEHPDPRKLFLPDNFEGNPLRREYPVEGEGERDSFAVLPGRDALDAAAREQREAAAKKGASEEGS